MAIHRSNLTGGARCGPGPDQFNHLRISVHGVNVTCADCIRLDTPDREAQLASIQAAAQRKLG